MKKYTFKKLDAFAKNGSSGNPAACVYLSAMAEIDEAGMQRIARELKGFVNEVVYVFPEGDGYFLRYYSSECEVDFCGHGTIAAMYDLVASKPELKNKPEIYIRVKNEKLSVLNQIAANDCVFIEAPLPVFLSTPPTNREAAVALGISPDIVVSAVEVVNGGLNTLIVQIDSLDNCLAINPGMEQLKDFCFQKGIDITLVYTKERYLNNTSYRTRVFAPKFGYLEDPATGSGNSAFGYCLMKNKMWNGNIMSIEQSKNKELPNIVKLEATQKQGAVRMRFGGRAEIKIEGVYTL